MAYRMACESADLIAGIASLAGMTFLDPSRCAPSQPVNILHIHGTADDSIIYLAVAFHVPARCRPSSSGPGITAPPTQSPTRCLR